MIADLQGSGKLARKADVAIVGGGTVGLVIASRLARAGYAVVCLESGHETQTDETHPLNEAIHTRMKYSGAAQGRFRCLGGTSTRWGGALIPFQRRDMTDAQWPIAPEEILRYCEQVEELFGLSAGPYQQQVELGLNAAGQTHLARAAKWPAFKQRNVYTLLKDDLVAERGPEIIVNATVVDFEVEGSRLERVIARAPDQSTISLEASQFVFCAGAIETTRLLLLLDRRAHGLLTRESDVLGRHFHDHLSAWVGTLESTDRKALNRLAGFRFESNGTMRNLRFELSGDTSLRDSIPPCFAHIAFEDHPASGFNALRNILRHVQQRKWPRVASLLELARDMPWFVRAVWWRIFERRLLYPDNAALQVHMVVEQRPSADNRITLSADEFDMFGNPLPEIAWSVSDEDFRNLHSAVEAFHSFWKSTDLSSLGTIIRRDPAAIEADIKAGGGIYHPGGSTRMSASARTGVVDPQLNVFGTANLRAVSTAVLPTGGGSNPTMMLLMLGLRCADDITEVLGASESRPGDTQRASARANRRIP